MNSSVQTYTVILVCCSLVVFALFIASSTTDNDSRPLICWEHSEKARLAIISYGKQTKKFIENSKKSLIGTNHLEPVQIQMVPAQRCNYIHVTYFDIEPNATTIQLNPCQSVSSSQDGANYDHFTHIFLVDSNVVFQRPFDANQLLNNHDKGDQGGEHGIVAVANAQVANAKMLKTFTSNQEIPSRPHFTSKFFGGSFKSLIKFCEKLNNSKSFHIDFNQLIHNQIVPPEVVLLPIGFNTLAENDSFFYQGSFVRSLTKEIEIPYDEEEIEFGRILEFDSDQMEIVQYQKAAQEISEAFRRNYYAKINRNIKDKGHGTKFVEATCTFLQPKCGGWGDRLRGLAATFVLAIASDRVFHVQHSVPVDLNEFFYLNHHLYNVSEEDLEAKRGKAYDGGSIVYNQIKAKETSMSMKTIDSIRNGLANYSYAGFVSNRYAGLTVLFKNQPYSDNLMKMSGFPLGNLSNGHFDFPLFISAAFRSVLGQRKPKLENLISKVLEQQIGLEKWEKSLKIGVQIRTGGFSGLDPDFVLGVVPEQVQCFTNEVAYLINERLRKSPSFKEKAEQISIFVSSDWQDATNSFRNYFKNVKGVEIFDTDTDDLPINHLDGENARNSGQWQDVAKVYVDWNLLTRMDFLFISSSGYGETAFV